MIAFTFDGTKDGLLTCVFDCYYNKKVPQVVTSSPLQTGFGDEIIGVETDFNKAERVQNCINSLKTANIAYDIDFALKSGEELKFTAIFNYIKKAIDNKDEDVSKNFADADVLNFRDIISRITFEAHRQKGFLRFVEAKDGFYYAKYEPDNDITELLMPHFKNRFKFPFIIHDVKRNILGLSDGKKYKVIKWNSSVDIYLSEGEENFEKLWKTYYKSVNIEERKNLDAMTRFLPKRYRKYMPETVKDLGDFN